MDGRFLRRCDEFVVRDRGEVLDVEVEVDWVAEGRFKGLDDKVLVAFVAERH